jgi:F-box and leucine-rich repeat protein GRR1
VCRLDSALCQKKRRPYFLALISKTFLLFNREEIHVLDHFDHVSLTHRALGAAALKWVLKRGIHLASLRLPRSYVEVAEQQSIRETVASLALNGNLDKLEAISLNQCFYIQDADLSAVLSKCYSSVKSIDIRWYGGLAESAAAHIKRCAKLEAFYPKGNETDVEMAVIVQSCRKLRKLDLSVFNDDLTDEVLRSVAFNCHLLEHLSLKVCSAVSDAAIRTLTESCPLLQYIQLVRTKITDATVVALCRSCPLLKRMFLWCRNIRGCRNLTDVAVLAVAERLPGLTHIELYDITAITSSAVETLASKCRDLEHINLGHCSNVSDITLTKIAEHCSKLEALYVYGCDDVTVAGLTEIATKCTKLKAVFFGNRAEISAASLQQMFPHVSWQSY